MSAIPIIDVSDLVAGDAAGTARVAAEIGAACREVGFFYVVGHSVPAALMQRTFAASRAFFAEDEADKKAVLYSAYMPFVQNGGLFVPTNKSYELGDEVFMLLTLMDEPEKIPIAGRVVWVTPRGAQGNRTAGIGVQFSDQDATANTKIEEYLAGLLNSEKPTHTL